MAYRQYRVPVQCSKPHDEVNLALRIAVARELRLLFRKRFIAGALAGADRDLVSQKLTLTFMAARKASRFTRNIAMTVVQWAGFVEYHRTTDGYPQPVEECIGSFNPGDFTDLPGSVYTFSFGSITLVGVSPEAIPRGEVAELRLERHSSDDGHDQFTAIAICGRPDDGPSEALPTPQPVEEVDA